MTKNSKLLISWIVCSLFPQLSQWRSWPTSAPLASVYVKLFGQEIAFANIDKSMIDRAIAVLFKCQLQDQFHKQLFITIFLKTKL